MDIQSYIQIPNKSLSDDFLEHPEDFFVNVDDTEKLKSIANDLDIDYLDGAITIYYQGHYIIDFALWDEVDTLWAYLMNAIEELLKNGKSHTYFPDQPIRIDLRVEGKGMIRLVIGKGEHGDYLLPREILLNSLINGAEHCFLMIKKLLKTDNNDYHLEQIKRIRQSL